MLFVVRLILCCGSVANLCHFPRFPHQGWEQVGRLLAKVHGVEWEEYWPFLDIMADLTTLEGVHKLNDYFKSKKTRFIRGSLPVYEDVDAFLAVREEVSLVQV